MNWQVTHWLDSSGNRCSASSDPCEPTSGETFSGDWQHVALHLTEPEVFFCVLRCPIVQSVPALLTALAPGLNKLNQKGRLIRGCVWTSPNRLSVNVPYETSFFHAFAGQLLWRGIVDLRVSETTTSPPFPLFGIVSNLGRVDTVLTLFPVTVHLHLFSTFSFQPALFPRSVRLFSSSHRSCFCPNISCAPVNVPTRFSRLS